MTRAPFKRAAQVVPVAIALVLSGCASDAGSQTSAPTSSATSVTTTSLPAQVVVGGTAVPGQPLLGLVRRVPVVAVPAGSSTVALPVAGDPGYPAMQRVAFRRFGTGPNLLMIMGQDGSMAWWEPSLLSILARHYRVTIFDFPGVGYSAPALVRVTLDWLADETAGLIEALGLGQPNVLGWGLGGEVALALAERHPASERSLVLVDTSSGGRGAARPAAAVSALFDSPAATPALLAPTLFADGSSAGVGTSSTGTSSTGTSSTGTSSQGSPAAASAEAAWLGAVESTVPDSVTQAGLAEERAVQLSVWSQSSLARSSSAVAVPTLIVFGSDDTVFPAADGVMLRRLIAASQRVVLQDAGYAAMFEDASQFAAALEQFTG